MTQKGNILMVVQTSIFVSAGNAWSFLAAVSNRFDFGLISTWVTDSIKTLNKYSLPTNKTTKTFCRPNNNSCVFL